MKYPDLSVYSFDKVFCECRNIGWLGDTNPSPGDMITTERLGKLLEISALPFQPYGGLHQCQLCPKNANDESMYVNGNNTGRRLGSDVIVIPNIRIPNNFYIAPNLICHYCSVHKYAPPGEFFDSLDAIDIKIFNPRTISLQVWRVDSIWIKNIMPDRFPQPKTDWLSRLFG